MVGDESARGVVGNDVNGVAAWIDDGIVGHEAAAPVAPAL
jgi:hypothetical protein